MNEDEYIVKKIITFSNWKNLLVVILSNHLSPARIVPNINQCLV